MTPTKRPQTFHISTYGCQMNLADSSTLASTLTTRGYRRVDDEATADLIILNTCSVREKAEERIYGRLGELYRFKKRRPHLKIAVVGCMAQRLGENLAQQVPHVDYVLGTDRVFELPDVLEGREGTTPVMTAFGHEDLDMIAPIKETPWSGFITISRGCDNYCTYCIVPYVRGKERSHSTAHILNAVRQMVAEGVVEITLLGQNVNSYRHEAADFPDLLRLVATETDIRRIRFMTSHPKDLSRKLIDMLASHPKFMPHVHLPLQSGSNRVLRLMGRVYTLEHYLKIITYLRATLPYVAITTDLIVGFPSETEAEYEETLAAVEQIRYDSAFMFRYSIRPGTTAAKYPDDVPEADKIRRLNRLIALQQAIGYEQNQRELGRVETGLVEGFSRRGESYYRARTSGNKTLIFPNDRPVEPGAVVSLRVTAADAFTLHGELAEQN